METELIEKEKPKQKKKTVEEQPFDDVTMIRMMTGW